MTLSIQQLYSRVNRQTLKFIEHLTLSRTQPPTTLATVFFPLILAHKMSNIDDSVFVKVIFSQSTTLCREYLDEVFVVNIILRGTTLSDNRDDIGIRR